MEKSKKKSGNKYLIATISICLSIVLVIILLVALIDPIVGRSKLKKVKYAAEGESLTEVTFEVNPEWEYIRFTVKDKFGKLACTNAYFSDELFEK